VKGESGSGNTKNEFEMIKIRQMETKRFNPAKLEKLNDPMRLKIIPLEQIMKQVALKNPKVMVDLGAGTGLFSAALARMFKNSKIYACDVSGIMVDWMKTNIAPVYNQVIPMLMEDSRVHLGSGIADFLLMINLHHELDNPLGTLKESFRLLKPGGKILISDWKKQEEDQGPDFDIRVDEQQVEEQLIEVGFKKVNVHSDLTHNYVIIAHK
jgi:SAM-dependent methyltransferase